MPATDGVETASGFDRLEQPDHRHFAKYDAGLSVLPWLLLGGSLALVLVLLVLPVSAPIGAMYWDTYTYYDAANRILSGQVPAVDFFTPAGPLGYVVAAAWIALFPNGQPTLLLHWSTLTMTVPLMALVISDLPKKPRSLGLLLVLPFLLFSLLPFNGKEYFPFPGSDGFAYYNRQTCLILFPFVSGLVFMRGGKKLIAFLALAMTILFFVKITGFLAAGLIGLFAVIVGRLRLTDAIMAALLFGVALAAIEVSTGVVSIYIYDIYLLATMNSGTLLPRILQALSINFGVTASLALVSMVLLFVDRADVMAGVSTLLREKSYASLASLLDRPAFWLAVVTIAGVLFETQNTASQAMIFTWPILLWILIPARKYLRSQNTTMLLVALCGAVYLPLVVNIVERAARAYIGVVGNEHLESENLKTLGAVNAKPDVIGRAGRMSHFYAQHRTVFDELARSGDMPSSILYSEFDFQIAYLQQVDAAIEAIRKLESASGVRFETMMSLNFSNPFPWLMQRHAPLHITVGADPFRAVPDPDGKTLKAIRNVDLALLPTCPLTPANIKLLDLFSPALANHRRIRLTECYDAFINPRFQRLAPAPAS